MLAGLGRPGPDTVRSGAGVGRRPAHG